MSENSLPQNLRGVHIHFVGIKGTGMAALVEILFHNGAIITGSDVSERFYTDQIIEKLGIKALPFDEKNITDNIQFVIYSSAYKLDKNPDLIQAVKKNVPCLLYTQALGSYSSKAYSCGICGVHGKTSTTGLTGTILKELDLPSQILAGSIINSFGNTCTWTSPLVSNLKNCEEKKYFVAETCEYQRHFMSFCPQKIVLTSVESDHQDYYPTYEDIRDAFVDYICKLPENGELIYCADDDGAVETANIAFAKRPDIKMIPYGQKAWGDFHLEFLGVNDEKNSFSISLLGRLFLKVPGKHEVLDACAAAALACRLLVCDGKDPQNYLSKIKLGLEKFSGGKRRSEIVGRFTNKNGASVVVVDDYGHHPTAIKTTLEGFREFYKGRKIIVDFMSHTYSRTQALLSEFASCFSAADCVVLHKIYASARENIDDFNINGRTLFEEMKKYNKNVYYFEEILDAKQFVLEQLERSVGETNPDGYLFVTMGAGDNWKLGKALLEVKND
ncbi:MAG: UDP-N-acetylmuramate--L-alanine ligase [Treponema sp.]|nr:UDP-N-acetylmuramate--L-alanine ligase [Treponema sp.]